MAQNFDIFSQKKVVSFQKLPFCHTFWSTQGDGVWQLAALGPPGVSNLHISDITFSNIWYRGRAYELRKLRKRIVTMLSKGGRSN